MLRIILLIIVFVGLTVSFGCKKEEPQTPEETMRDLQRQTEEAGEEAKEGAEEAKEKAGEEMEKAGEKLQE